jgi:hypothetical protein
MSPRVRPGGTFVFRLTEPGRKLADATRAERESCAGHRGCREAAISGGWADAAIASSSSASATLLKFAALTPGANAVRCGTTLNDFAWAGFE